MSATTLLCRLLTPRSLDFRNFITPTSLQIQQYRDFWKPTYVPKPGIKGKAWRRIVHFEDEYTVKPLNVTNLAGRDPVTGK